MTTPPLSHRLHTILTTAVSLLDLPLTNRHLESLAEHLAPAVRALQAEASASTEASTPVRYAVARDVALIDEATDVATTEYAGCVSRIQVGIDHDAPAAALAHELRSHQPDVILTDVPTETYLGLTVRPQSLTAWSWWLDHLGVHPDVVTLQGDEAYAIGETNGTVVQICGDGVGRLMREASGRPAWGADLDTPAGTVAAKARRQPDVTGLELLDAHTVGITVRPASLMEWRWWLQHLAVTPASVTFEGTTAVATGSSDGATVHLRGDDCRGFYTDEGAARLAGLITAATP